MLYTIWEGDLQRIGGAGEAVLELGELFLSWGSWGRIETLSITNYQLPITHYPLPITHYQLPITHYPLPITQLGY
jgi:hypothetical protein